MGSTVQTNATNNQSTASFSFPTLFIFDNRFLFGAYKNNTVAPINLKRGMLVARNTAVAGGFIPVTADNLADTIGISAVEEDVNAIAAAASVNINICTSGTVDGLNLVLPATITLDTAVGQKSLQDVLNSLGFEITTNSVENTKHEL